MKGGIKTLLITETWEYPENQAILYTENQQLAEIAANNGLREMTRYWRDGKQFAIQFIGQKDVVQKVFSHVETVKQIPIDIETPNPFNELAEEMIQNKLQVQHLASKKCAICGKPIPVTSNSRKYCPKCRKEAYAEAHRRAARNYYHRNKH
jgi:predicted RNA-binding Zn-ribbon protein involved in translation (DUF1610 family)